MVKKVATPDGSKRYGKPIGSPIGGGAGRTAKAYLSSLKTTEKSNAPKASLPEGRVHSSDYGMTYDPKGEHEVARARTVAKEDWDKLPTTTIRHGTRIIANEETLKRKHIDKVVSGEVPFREGYVNQMWQDKDGNLHVADGHHRVAMYNALGKDMPAKVMNEAGLKRIEQRRQVEGIKHKRTVQKMVREADAELAANPVENHEKEPAAAARAVARSIQGKAAAAEPFITEDVGAAALSNNATPIRLAFRLKTEKSFALKIDRNMAAIEKDGGTTTLEAEAAKIKDAVRYTALADTANYWESGDAILASLVAKGYKVTKDKGADHTWPRTQYRGRNVQLETPDGVPLEVQIHTKESLDTAESNHLLYNEWRHQDTSDERKEELHNLMAERFEAIPVPPGTTIDDSPRKAG